MKIDYIYIHILRKEEFGLFLKCHFQIFLLTLGNFPLNICEYFLFSSPALKIEISINLNSVYNL